MALRREPPEGGDFYISKAGTFACAVYRRRGADAGTWVTYTEEQAHYAPARWVQRQIEETGEPVALPASRGRRDRAWNAGRQCAEIIQTPAGSSETEIAPTLRHRAFFFAGGRSMSGTCRFCSTCWT
jgi:hypothetical protein